ncbi:MAG: ABC-type transport system, multidrug-familypermease [Sedimentibacter sp.]|nr:ABC-type transport system, multidrug-familypermease [Sedimentibacter sp.]
MKTYYVGLYFSFKQFIKQIYNDAMIFMICLAPILYILLFRYGLPLAEEISIEYIDLKVILSPYYLVFDLFLAVLTPTMFSYASAMVILGEIDDGITNYFAITPVGKEGYLISRLIFPLLFSLVITIIAISIFSITKILLRETIIISIMSTMLGYIMCMIVIAMSTNKVEGLAVMKLSGLLLIGILAPFFIKGNIQYMVSFLPSLWLSKYAVESNNIYLILYFLVSTLWVLVLNKRFKSKLL